LPSDRELLRHIKAELDFRVRESRTVGQDDFLASDLLQRAFARSLEIVGEAVKKLSNDFVLQNPKVEWRRMAGMRDKLIHGYFAVDYRIVWDVISDKVPTLQRDIAMLLEAGR
jgi:uncharacterized protein with HEPN domain